MNVLYVYCHPLDDSFHAAIRKEALAGLKEAGHTIDLLDLYAEHFDPVLSAGAWGSLSAVQAFFTARGYRLFDVFGRPLPEDQPVPEANIWARDRSADPFAPC